MPTASDLITLTGASPTLSLGGITTITPSSVMSDGTYTLINGISSIAAGDATMLALDPIATANTRSTPTVSFSVGPPVTLTISGSTANATSLEWQGTNGSNWDVSTVNWLNYNSSLADHFYNLDTVTFDDTGMAPVSLVGTLYPSSITINSVNTNNVFNGSGSIAGAATLTLNGTSTTTIGTANSFSGGTTVNAGTLKLANANALGNGTGPLTLAGGILDLNSNNLSVQTFSGVAGAIVTNSYDPHTTNTTNPQTLTVNQVVSNTFAGLLLRSTHSGATYTNNDYISLVRMALAICCSLVRAALVLTLVAAVLLTSPPMRARSKLPPLPAALEIIIPWLREGL